MFDEPRSPRKALQELELSVRRAAIKQQRVGVASDGKVAFVFLGEFGYELLNWHGRIRQLHRLNPDLEITAVSRLSTEVLYTFAQRFVPLEEISSFNDYAADGYFARYRTTQINSIQEMRATKRLHHVVKRALQDRPETRDCQIVFSDTPTLVRGLSFGANRFLYGHDLRHADINNDLDVGANDYVTIDPGARTALTESANGRILMMRASRDRVTRYHELVSQDEIISFLAAEYGVCLMEFQTNRWDDTVGHFSPDVPVQPVVVSNLRDQVELIRAASLCLFFTEGDFRSHTYVPPLAGRDVFVLGEAAVFANGAIPLWNRHVFRFGGQLRPLPLETFDPANGGKERLLDLVARQLGNAGKRLDAIGSTVKGQAVKRLPSSLSEWEGGQ